MTNQSEFGDFEESFSKTQKAEAGGGGGDLIPESVYRGVLSRQDVRGDGVLVDHEVIKSKADSKGVKVFLEIIDPAEVKVGLIVPLSGLYARPASVMRMGAEIGIDDVNGAGGIKALGGAKLKLVLIDCGDTVSGT